MSDSLCQEHKATSVSPPSCQMLNRYMSKQGGRCYFYLSNPTSGQSFHVRSSSYVEFTWGQINFREENPRVRLLPVFQDPAWRHAGTTGKLTSGGTGWELGPCANVLGILKRALFSPTAAVSASSSMLPCPLPPAQKTADDVMRKTSFTKHWALPRGTAPEPQE